MRFCSCCVKTNVLCVIFPLSESCEQCVRFNRDCELSFPVAKFDKLSKQEGELFNQITECKTRACRLRKQRRLLLKKIRDLGDREARNIFKIKMDEMVSDLPEILQERVILSEALNSLSPLSASFTAPVKGEGSTDPFFGLLDFFSKSVKVP
jgi:hypothetical protein